MDARCWISATHCAADTADATHAISIYPADGPPFSFQYPFEYACHKGLNFCNLRSCLTITISYPCAASFVWVENPDQDQSPGSWSQWLGRGGAPGGPSGGAPGGLSGGVPGSSPAVRRVLAGQHHELVVKNNTL